ncbi:multidrug efflux system protein [Roseovarius sp. EC-HK134]|jgi:HAE1 family hydrophobic/amphiphilic exporter-1/multidrug efflux pump|uniref:Efflux pump membrane transporter n=1 Tax=Roseovarius mucosus TaxID=215743 RepID=A0A1V0RR06_9RHOB|nr:MULTISPECIES: efflux RND transporter permease subunit [Roseovarius]ARE84052.1 multidrug resistance protein MexB [Roseovarius mucosus]AWZ19303.1 RND efflux system, inner membrane transporter CmeB [Roseovarius sp. AK1035]EDM33481.1 Cation/multidrug efflux pump, RND family protein [Roseovarius sp. TM1035]MBW4975181.1 efflux RND transporter permease subunit [Roseovarius mucosus]VVT03716.1 multidrug efflux system protein [Roseovarius sp. EC-HK134]
MASFFIDRPVFAWVISILIMGVGVLAILILPVAQYPQIAPPSVTVTANYPGASADTVANTVTQVIEQQMTGLDGLRYFSSRSTSAGSAEVTLTFETGTDADIAQVQVQNKLGQATPLLPEIVQRQGITVEKSSAGFLMVVGMISTDGTLDQVDLSDYMVTNLVDELSRTEGVGSVNVFGAQYAMRIWLDPSKLAGFGLTPSDVVAAVSAQNAQISAGAFGAQPAVEGQQLNATITAQSLLSTPEDFRQIVLRAETDGGLVLLDDVARVEIGAENYATTARFNTDPAAGMAITLAPGANALDTARAIKERMVEFARFFPEGVDYVIPYDTTPFVEISIKEVVKTLFEAIGLVFLVMFLFLQNLRATLIPTLAVPVVLLGTFGVLAAAGFSINTLTMLAMVLAIGLLVDDAIVVVENVERIMEEEGLGPREATHKSMGQITGALVGIAMVLSAVFVPMAFFPGSTGVIYQQFAITIVSAMALSVVVAITLTPALCASLLKAKNGHGATRGPFAWFNTGFGKLTNGYGGAVGWSVRRPVRVFVVYLALALGMALMFLRTPTGFLPEEDQGILFTLIQTPTGSSAERTLEVIKQVEDYYLEQETDVVNSMFGVVGFSFSGNGQNMGLAFVQLKDWEERTEPGQSVQALAGRAFGAFSQIRDAMVFPVVPPSVIELGNVSGFDFYLQARAGQSHADLMAARNQLLGMAAQSDLIASARPNGLEDAAQYNLDIDWRKAGAMGLTPTDVGQLLQIAWAGSYVNDFLDQGRIKRVYVQGEADARAQPTDIDKWRVRNASGGLVPFSNFAEGRWDYGAQGLYRYNGIPSVQLQGSPAPGVSTGEAMAEMERLVAELGQGYELAWTGLSLEERESGNQAPLLYALSLAAVFLSLAALYESWSIPFAVMLAMPIGIVGALTGAWIGGFENGVFFQVGLLTVVGLTGKNAILIVEFARERYEAGETILEAVIEAARQRFRPIIMTSMAFSLGVLPLVLSSGAGSGGRNAIGSGVLSGTISGTVLGVVFVPLFFVIVTRLFGRAKSRD